ncbi:La domain-containing protein [Haematococcus lacustris]
MAHPVYTPEQKAKIVKQVEFYFSDSNLPKDRFLKAKVAEDPMGYVDLKVVIAFARMREALNLTGVTEPAQVPDEVVAAVAALLRARAKVVEVNSSGTRLRRSQPLESEEVVSAAVDARSLYAAPFPLTTDVDKLTIFFCSLPGVTLNCVRMRRHATSKQFKGSVFVEFASVEEAEKVLAMNLVYEGAPLRLAKKVEYVTAKKAQRKAKAGKAPAKQGDEDADHSNDELSDGVGGKAGGPVVEGRAALLAALPPKPDAPARAATTATPTSPTPDSQQQEARGKKRERKEGEAGAAEAASPSAGAPPAKEARQDEAGAEAGEEGEGEGMEDDGGEAAQQEAGAAQSDEPKFEPGRILGFELEEAFPDLVTMYMITDEFGGKEKLKFVELMQGRQSGYLRFGSPELATAALTEFQAKPEAEKTIMTIKASLKLVEGEEEKDYHRRVSP